MNKKKIAVLVGDGMADYPVESLGNRTPLEAASTPNMDYLASNGVLGMARTVPRGMAPGSDTANISIFGYNPAENYTGRAPLEALNMGIEMGPGDVAFRCNLVTIDGEEAMADFSAHHIETEFARVVIDEFRREIAGAGIEFYPGVSYRHLMMWRDYPHGELPETTPPHDIQGEKVGQYMPRGTGSDLLRDIMERSRAVIADSAVIRGARSKYRGKPVSAWLWGAGRRPSLSPLAEKYGLYGFTISAVDLIHGIGRAVGLEPLRVEGSTGYIDTNYAGKADALLYAMQSANFVFLHVESPDESGHEGSLEHKIKAIEDFDAMVVGRVLNGLKRYDDYVILVMPDHPTPLSIRTHTADPVPFCIYGKNGFAGGAYDRRGVSGFNEREASMTGIFVEEGHRLLEIILSERF